MAEEPVGDTDEKVPFYKRELVFRRRKSVSADDGDAVSSDQLDAAAEVEAVTDEPPVDEPAVELPVAEEDLLEETSTDEPSVADDRR